ncbi:hypothetical protein AL533_02525 [Acinetobacter nosocomialis]|uniref:Uncharacterized protein n=1 Tax=Acinetobacter nosocomialis TaxID=106654 RepID=A0A2L1VDL7_ACINO|nr:hypothetical protein AL533_02525 [Acinetobacter nosocomialis]RSN87481.1 hypothetical protein EA768_04345 [Acinetobacter nosocomialis]
MFQPHKHVVSKLFPLFQNGACLERHMLRFHFKNHIHLKTADFLIGIFRVNGCCQVKMLWCISWM